MLLRKLVEYADSRALPPSFYSPGVVRYLIDLDYRGQLLSTAPIDLADPSNPASKRGQRRLVPQVARANVVRPLLLADSADYTLGMAKNTEKAHRAPERHKAYLELLSRCMTATQEPSATAVMTFLANTPRQKLCFPEDFDPAAVISFRVNGVIPIDLPSIQAFWASINDPDNGFETPGTPMQCVVCGEEKPALRIHPWKIKGVKGGQTSGTSIISANREAFLSYGLKQSFISPTCLECGEKFHKAANFLLADRRSSIVLGNANFIFWTRKQAEFSFRDFLDDPKPEDVRALIESVRSGKRSSEVDDNAFYATTLSASGSRTVVRDWIDTTVADVQRNLATWFSRQAIVSNAGEQTQPLGLYALSMATVRDSKDLSPATPRALLRSALAGSPLPMSLLYQTVRRIQAEAAQQGDDPRKGVTRQRAALIKLVLRSQQKETTEDKMVQLDRESESAAYQCGRLLAVLEQVQKAAIPGAKATIVDRFFGTASSAPSSVFGRLLRGAQPHLAKLERDRHGAYVALQGRLEEIQSHMTGFPKVLTLEDQGRFVLGYYHQRASDRAQTAEAKARRLAGLTAPTDSGLDIPEDGQ